MSGVQKNLRARSIKSKYLESSIALNYLTRIVPAQLRQSKNQFLKKEVTLYGWKNVLVSFSFLFQAEWIYTFFFIISMALGIKDNMRYF